MKKKNETTNGPDMTTVQMKELKQLRAEERRLLLTQINEERRVLADIKRLEAKAEKEVRRVATRAEKEIRAIERRAEGLLKPVRKAWTRMTAGKVKNERLAAVRHRIAILEGRNQ